MNEPILVDVATHALHRHFLLCVFIECVVDLRVVGGPVGGVVVSTGGGPVGVGAAAGVVAGKKSKTG